MIIYFLSPVCEWNCQVKAQVPASIFLSDRLLLPGRTLRPFAFPMFLHMIELSHGKNLITWYDWWVLLMELLQSELWDWPYRLFGSSLINFAKALRGGVLEIWSLSFLPGSVLGIGIHSFHRSPNAFMSFPPSIDSPDIIKNVLERKHQVNSFYHHPHICRELTCKRIGERMSSFTQGK